MSVTEAASSRKTCDWPRQLREFDGGEPLLTASELLQRHFQTLVVDNGQWQTLISDDLVWELPYAPALGHPARLSGRVEVTRHVSWFIGAVENVRVFDLNVHAFADAESAAAEVKAEGLISLQSGCTVRTMYCFCEPAAGRSLSFASISIPHEQHRR
jgi:uncharacterized protein